MKPEEIAALKMDMDLIIQDCNDVIKRIQDAELLDEQFVLDFLDSLNALSVTF